MIGKKNILVMLIVFIIFSLLFTSCGKKNIASVIKKQTVPPPAEKVTSQAVQNSRPESAAAEARALFEKAKSLRNRADAEYTKALDAGLKDYLSASGKMLDLTNADFKKGNYTASIRESGKTLSLINDAYSARENDIYAKRKGKTAHSYLKTAKNFLTKAKNNKADILSAGLFVKAQKAYTEADNYFSSNNFDSTIKSAKRSIKFAKASISRALLSAKKEEKRTKRVEKNIQTALKKGAGRKPAKYIVVKGDCLWTISKQKKIYGTPLKWKKIWLANESGIVDPDLIYPKQIFSIPR